MSRPFIPISKPLIGEAEQAAVLEVLASGQLAQGPRVAALEEAFRRRLGAAYAVATSSGTSALHLALLAHGVGVGDEVVTTPFSFVATANAILMTGARPVFADISECDFNLDPNRVEAALTTRTRAILPVHLYGRPCDVAALETIAGGRGLALIEDAAQALGAGSEEAPVGARRTACFSLYATKNATSGEGGMVTTDDGEVAARLRLLRQHGMSAPYRYEVLGYNQRLSDVHAAIGLAQLSRLDEFLAARRANAAALGSGLRKLRPPQPHPGHAWHQFTVRVETSDDRERVVAHLAAEGVGTGVFYPVPLHFLPHVRAAAGEFSLPVAERMAREVLSLPVHPGVGEAELQRILNAANAL